MHTNQLIHESSPYLLQHAHNPVNWLPWGDTAIQLAQKENKMLLISVGYAACHWCHVMEKESYEDEAVADIMNKYFVPVKVDREERPDVDQIYMNAAYLISGNGGWPLNALAMPDGKPFFAGTYFPKEKWIELLLYFANIFEAEPQKLQQQAQHLSEGIADIENVPMNNAPVSFSQKDLDDIFFALMGSVDMKNGGIKGSVKFPMPSIWEFLLQYYHITKNETALPAVEAALDNMALGGIYDQVGGGFSRYSTDAAWHAPHFEKMLYDNAQLVSLYSKAFQATGKLLYKRIVYETIEFINRELSSDEGAFYSSLDADSEGAEGKFYVWTKPEISQILGEDADLFSDYFGITSEGNWEDGQNIPDARLKDETISEKYGLDEKDLHGKIESLKKIVLSHRAKRARPATDDKILTSWNALMSVALTDAYRAFGEEKFLELAKRNLDFLLKKMKTSTGGLFRNYKNGKATIRGFLDDYAFTISALIQYYQVTFDECYLQVANDFLKYVNTHFFDIASGLYFYTDAQYADLIARKMEISDNVIPSSNSEMCKNLAVAGLFFENSSMQSQALQMVKNVADDIQKMPRYYSNWAQALILQMRQPFEVAIVGKAWKQKLAGMQKQYLPGVLFVGGEREGTLPLLENKLKPGQTLIYVCKNKSCQSPVEDSVDALAQLNN